MKDLLVVLRELAKSDYYQSLYAASKELGFTIFQNTTELTKIQLWFLSFMSTYSMIHIDIALGEINERVLENTTYEDAYLIYKKHNNSKDIKNKDMPIKTPSQESSPKSQWIFKRTK